MFGRTLAFCTEKGNPGGDPLDAKPRVSNAKIETAGLPVWKHCAEGEYSCKYQTQKLRNYSFKAAFA